MERAHDGMTIQPRRVLQFYPEATGLDGKYVELNGEMPLAGYGWEPEIDEPYSESRIETTPSVDRFLDPGEETIDDDFCERVRRGDAL